MMEQEELKPCPFCGEEIALENHFRNTCGLWVVTCLDCGAECGGGESSDKAIESWNKRPEDKALSCTCKNGQFGEGEKA